MRPENTTKLQTHTNTNAGLLVTPLTPNQFIDAVHAIITSESTGKYIIFLEGNLLRHYYKNSTFADALANAALVIADGVSAALIASRAHRRTVARIPGPDAMPAIFRFGLPHGYRHFFYGGTPQTLKQLLHNVKSAFPGLIIAGSYSPPYTQEDNRCEDPHVHIINTCRPDIVWVALGGPKQEIWMRSNCCKLNASVLLGVGAAFDFLAGTKPRAPKWMRDIGAEWLFRMATGGRRITKRNLKAAVFAICLLAKTYMPNAHSAPREKPPTDSR